MKIESTKNIIKQIEGTNTFEVKTVGKRLDLQELRAKLEISGFTFGNDGKLINSYERIRDLIKKAKDMSSDNQLKAIEMINEVQHDANEYLSLYIALKEFRTFEFSYILDMSDIEIIAKDDIEGNRGLKAIINLKEDKDGMLFVGKEIESNIFDREDNRIIKISNYKY